MELFLKALDLIWKLIPALKSLTGERRRDYFEKVIQPLFESVETVHDFYNELILTARKRVVDVKVVATPFFGNEFVLTEAGKSELDKLKREFLEARMKDEGLRDDLRNEAQQVFSQIKWPEEKRLLASIVYYFLGTEAIAPTDDELDRDIQDVIDKGGPSHWDTPSIRLYQSIRQSENPEEILDLLDEARHGLNQRHMNIRLHYRRVQHELIMET